MLDIDRKKIKKNAYRVTKERGKTALRIRVPAGHLETKYFDIIREIADTYGNKSVHMTTRQGFEIPDIDFDKIPEINKKIKDILNGMEKNIGVEIIDLDAGYPSAGTRNISACIGNRVCPFANFDTTGFAFQLEKEIYPNDYHVKIAVTGCPNDCIKAHMQDVGIIGMTLPELEIENCIGCEACVRTCKQRVTEALSIKNGKVFKEDNHCIGCGECILVCPTSAWTRSSTKFYRMIIMGRTGKKNLRIASEFLRWANEEVIFGVVKNLYKFIDENIDRSLVKEHVGYIFDRVGYIKFKDTILEGINLNQEIKIAEKINFNGYVYPEIISGEKNVH